MNRMCSVCGKEITAKFRKTYCSDICRFKASFTPKKKRIRKRKETLCWSCDNACTGCSWSKHLIPVKGWDATPIKLKLNSETKEYTDSFIVNDCPEFVRTRRVK